MAQYVMDQQASSEAIRLAMLEAWADPGTKEILSALGVSSGWRCLEVGAGAGSIAKWLCERVGAEGNVVATDIDCRLLNEFHLKNLEVCKHDIMTDDLPDRTFDLVHARMVLEHISDRRAALRAMASSLRPGGWLVVEDQDIFTVRPMPEADLQTVNSFTQTNTALVKLLTMAGVDLGYGGRVYSELLQTGLEDVTASGRISVVESDSQVAEFWRLTWKALQPLLVSSKLLTENQIDEIILLLHNPGFSWTSPAIIAAWGKRPEIMTNEQVSAPQ